MISYETLLARSFDDVVSDGGAKCVWLDTSEKHLEAILYLCQRPVLGHQDPTRVWLFFEAYNDKTQDDMPIFVMFSGYPVIINFCNKLIRKQRSIVPEMKQTCALSNHLQFFFQQ